MTRPRAQFYATPATLAYLQAGMFWFYLAKQHAASLGELIAQLSDRTIDSNVEVRAYLTQATGMTLSQLDAA